MAASIMNQAPGALHLRTLSTLNDLSSDQSNTVIFAIPIEGLEALKGISELGKAKGGFQDPIETNIAE